MSDVRNRELAVTKGNKEFWQLLRENDSLAAKLSDLSIDLLSL